MGEPVLEVTGVRKSYGTGQAAMEVLHGIDLRIEPGEFAALIGPSGSGKSTMLHLMGLLERPTSGTVRVAGRDTAHLADDEFARLRGRTLGFVFQFHHLLRAFSALENVMLPVIADRDYATAGLRERASDLLSRVGLAGYSARMISDMSGGEQQRVAIARALVADPRIVLADEPSGNLDTRSSDEVFRLLRAFNRERGTAFVIVTHDNRLAERCDRVIEIVDGKIVTDRRMRSS